MRAKVDLVAFNRDDTFTAVAAGTFLHCINSPPKYFSMSVRQTGTVTSWSVDLEVSLDKLNWQAIITHTLASSGNGKILSCTVPTAALYFRANCTSLTLGAGTNIICTILGIQ